MDLSKLTPSDKKKINSKAWRMKYLYSVKDRENKIRPFQRNAAQMDYTRKRWYFNIVLKARRLGFSTEIDISCLDDALFNPYDILVIAHTKDDGVKLFEDKIMTAWDNLDKDLKTLWNVDTQRANKLKFDWGEYKDPKTGIITKNTSSITVSNSGRSGGYTRVHISEFGKICALFPQKAEEIISGTLPTIPYGGQLDIESTAEGDYGYFHDMFWEAWNDSTPDSKRRKNQLKAHFYNWQWDKEEINRIGQPIPLSQMENRSFFTDYQREHKLTDLEITYYYLNWKKYAKNFRILKQEFPTTPQEAFASSGDKFFDPTNLSLQEQTLRDPIREEGPWKIYKDPVSSHSYAVGIDSSEGIGGDNATIVIIDFSTRPKPEVVAVFCNNFTPPDMLGYEAKTKGLLYNTAFLVPESNNHGHTVIKTLKEIYPVDQIYYQIKTDKAYDEETEKLGWQTNISTKSQMFSDINAAINENAISLVDKNLFTECRTFPRHKVNQVSTKDDGTLGHWDRLTSLALAFQGRDRLQGEMEPAITYVVGDNPNKIQQKMQQGKILIPTGDEIWYNKDGTPNYLTNSQDDFDPNEPI